MTLALNLCLAEFYPQPVETVWQALTDPDAIAVWLMPCDFRPIVGHQFTIRGDATEQWRGYTRCTVVRLEAPTLMEWLWESADIDVPTRVRFELQAVNGGTRLSLRHTGTTTGADRESLSAGWPEKLRQFHTYLTDRNR